MSHCAVPREGLGQARIPRLLAKCFSSHGSFSCRANLVVEWCQKIYIEQILHCVNSASANQSEGRGLLCSAKYLRICSMLLSPSGAALPSPVSRRVQRTAYTKCPDNTAPHKEYLTREMDLCRLAASPPEPRASRARSRTGSCISSRKRRGSLSATASEARAASKKESWAR